MKKWYRIYEIVNGEVKLTNDSKENWYEKLEYAEMMVEYYIKQKAAIYTILPIYERYDPYYF